MEGSQQWSYMYVMQQQLVSLEQAQASQKETS